MNTIDTRGHLCPMPLIMLIKALKERKEHIGLCVLTDNDISKNNILSFLRDNGYKTECVQESNHWSISILEENLNGDFFKETVETPDPLKTSKKLKPNHTLIINRDKMGQGNDELGEILLKGYFNALSEIDEGPEKIIFYNSGVLLCRKSYSEIENLQKLSKQGIDLILCGACVDYFKIKEEIAVGRISNMLAICELLEKSEKVVYL